MGKSQRDKGYRVENEARKKLEAHGLDAYRVPLSGGASIKGDVVIRKGDPLPADEWTLEIKARANGFKQIYKWLEDADALVLKADRQKELVVLDMDDFCFLLCGQHGEDDVGSR